MVQCALHYGKFDVKTGAPLSPPCTVALPTYRVKVDSGRVLLELP